MRGSRVVAAAGSETVASLEPYMQLFSQSHPSWPWFLGTLVTAGGGACAAFNYIVQAQMHPILRDVDQLVKATQEISSSQQRLDSNQQALVQTLHRMEKEHAAAFNRLDERIASVLDR